SIIELIQFNTIIICVYRIPNSIIIIFVKTIDTIISNLINKGKSFITVCDLDIDFLGRRVNLQLQTMLNSYGLQAIFDVPTRIGPRGQTAIDQIILNKGLWGYNLKVIETGFSDHKAQILQIQMQYKNKNGQVRLKEEFGIARSYREENVQYLNCLLEKETWELVFKQNSANEAYNEFLGTLQYYYDIAMHKKRVKTKQPENKWVTSRIRVSRNRLRFLNSLMKEGNMPEEFIEYYYHYKKYTTKLSVKQKN
ncbi:hypothetical protein B7P43_G07494, partial [Cryptotermes secundus]